MPERYCSNCGQLLGSEARFCQGCGSPAHETARVPTPEADVDVPPISESEAPSALGAGEPPSRSGGGSRKWWLWGCLAIAAVVFLVFLVLIFSLASSGYFTESVSSGNAQNPNNSSSSDSSSSGSPSASSSDSSSDGPGAGQTFDSENYSELVADPDSYEGAEVNITGQLLEAPERQDGELAFQMWADPANLDWSTVVYFDDPGLSLNTDEYVKVTGTVLGALEGENAFGGTVSAVGVQADTVVNVDPVEAVDPAEIEVDVGNSLTDQGFSITVDRIEFAENSTRVYVTIQNGTDSVADFYSFDSNIVQGSGQIDQETPFDYELEEPQSSINPGVETSGAIVYGPVDPYEPFDINFEWSSRNYNITPRPMTLQISAN